jgi:hypothetical protein
MLKRLQMPLFIHPDTWKKLRYFYEQYFLDSVDYGMKYYDSFNK